ncbi:MAG: hypothetical protein QM737_23300 [Ferruginibacter sp.]
MRRHLLCLLLPLLYFSCNEPGGSTGKTEKVEKKVSNDTILPVVPILSKSSKLFLTEPSQKIIVPSGKTTLITAAKGLKITVDPLMLETGNGLPLGGQIEVKVKEINNQEELFRNDSPTASNGELLVSGGAYHIEMYSAGNKLRIKPGKWLDIQIPARSDEQMELFYGERDSSGILNWVTADKKLVKEKQTAKRKYIEPMTEMDSTVPDTARSGITQNDDDAIRKLLNYASTKDNRLTVIEFDSILHVSRNEQAVATDTASSVIDQVMVDSTSKMVDLTMSMLKDQNVPTVVTTYYAPVRILNMGWINCDRFYKKKECSNIYCQFDDSLFSPAVNVCVIFKRFNSMQQECIYEYDGNNIKLKNQYPIGEPVKIIAYAGVKDKMYVYSEELTLAKNEKIKLKFSEVPDIETIKKTSRN